MNTQHHFIIGIIGTVMIASLLAIITLKSRDQSPPSQTALLPQGAFYERRGAPQADLKLATRGNTTNNVTTNTMTQNPEQRGGVGGPGPAPAGCNLYASMLYRTTGTMLTYTITINSIGTETCVNVSYSVYYPEGQQYVSALPKPTASNYYWELGDMRADEARTLTLTATNVNGELTEMCATANNAKADACAVAMQNGSAPQAPVIVSAPQPSPTPAPAPKPALTTTPTPAPTTSKKDPDTFATPSGKELGVWVWDSPLSLSSQKMDSIVATADTVGMKVIYLTVDDVLVEDKAQFSKALATFVSKAHAKGIAVDAVAGARDWAKPAVRHKGYAVIDFVIEYNRSNPKIRALQYDVEPYLLPEYERNKAPVLTDFVTFIDASAQRLAGSGIRFAVVIPHFYDSTQSWTPKVVLQGTSDHTYRHILRILDRNPGSMVVVMAYRNYFEGAGGTREIVAPEVAQAGVTKVIVAQETGNVEPDYVTFYGHSRGDLFSALRLIQHTFKNQEGFGGVAVHYIDPFLELRY